MKILSTRARALVAATGTKVVKSLKSHYEQAEFSRCMDSAAYFIENYIIAPHSLTYGQKVVLNSLQDQKRTIVNRARLTGMTSLGLAYLFWEANFKHERTSLAVVNTRHQLNTSMSLLRHMHDKLPKWMKMAVHGQYSDCLSFVNGSRICVRAPSKDIGRGLTLSTLFIDDLATISADVQEPMLYSLLPCLDIDSRCLISSVPGKVGDKFHQMWEDSCQQEEPFFDPIELDFRDIVVPFDYDAAREVMDQETFMREYMCEFLCEPVHQSSLSQFETRGEDSKYRNRLAPHERDFNTGGNFYS